MSDGFRAWLLEEKADTDLAYDVRQDPDWPDGADDHETIRRYLEACGAIPECLEVFDRLWAEYRPGTDA